MTDEGVISHVADTALWMAHIRAVESDRPNPLFRDLLAGPLSGVKGHAIARSVPGAALSAWGVVIRTSAIDRLTLWHCSEALILS